MRACFIALSLLGLAGACGEAAAEEGGPPGPRAMLVTVGTAREGALEVSRTYLGTVRSVARASLAAGADGQVLSVEAREGDRIRVGQVLVRIDSSLARSQLAAAQAAAERAHSEQEQAAREAQRFEGAGPNTVSQLEIERAAASAEALEASRRGSGAEVARARATLQRHRVTAPFSGIVAARMVDVGDWVSPGTPVLELVADDESEVLVRVEPELLRDVEVGSSASIRRGNEQVQATVVGVVPALDAVTRTAQLRLRPVSVQAWLFAGAAVDVELSFTHEGEGVIIPRDALVDGVAQSRVVRVVDSKAHPVVVEVIERTATEVRVRAEGLSASDTVVTRGNERLRADQPVRLEGQ